MVTLFRLDYTICESNFSLQTLCIFYFSGTKPMVCYPAQMGERQSVCLLSNLNLQCK